METRLPPRLRPPVEVALAKTVEKMPRPDALPGGLLFEPKWDGYGEEVEGDKVRRLLTDQSDQGLG